MLCCNYIVTTTPSRSPLLLANQVRPGTHITALGADSPGKQELDPYILKKADLIIVDSKSQCNAYSETYHALTDSLIEPSQIHEIGEVIRGAASKRTTDQQITVADLTGLAIQDLKIAECLFSILTKEEE
jgi:ornithine cyclodeaminase